MTSPACRPKPWLLVAALAACASGLLAMGGVIAHVAGEVAHERADVFAPVKIVTFQDLVKMPGMAARGEGLFGAQNCASCHGYRLEGILGPCLTDDQWLHGDKPEDIRKMLNTGSPLKGMPSFAALSEDDKAALVAFIYSRKVTPLLLPLKKGQDSMLRDMLPDAAVPKTHLLSPQEAVADMRVPGDCAVSCVAAEPLVVMPVAGAFDARGRLWVVEMRAFMRDLGNEGEHDPVGRMAVLEDTDGDGVFDKRTEIFTDLVSPRALLPYHDGVLFADDTRLLWAPVDGNLKPGPITVVDKNYAHGGTVEHKPNGLFPHLDGWIYNAKSDARYRRIHGTDRWQKGTTSPRGQWGISSDDFGRLAANTNSNFAFMDVFPPNFLTGNARVKKSNPTRDVGGTKVMPRRVTPGVNRAYQNKILDIEGKLRDCTSACAPWFARGAAMGSWQGLFVCEPTSHLLKCIQLKEDGNGQPKGASPLHDTEFLTAADELFRPVSLIDSPDGSMLVVDMHTGIIQHKVFVSGYLARYVKKFGLEKFTGFGRLFRIRATGAPLENRHPQLDRADGPALVQTLSHPSGWWRDMARRQIVERQVKEAAPLLHALLKASDRPEVRVQALWALANLGDLHAGDLPPLMAGKTPTGLRLNVCQAALGLPVSESPELARMLGAFVPANAVEAAGAARLAASLGGPGWPVLDTLLADWSGKPYVKDAAVVGLGKAHDAYAKRPGVAPDFTAFLSGSQVANHSGKRVLTQAENEQFKVGAVLFTTCAGCHGADGAGLDNQGPPLDGSQWVAGDKDRLLAILLCGLGGPVTVAGEKVSVPMEMPGFGGNETFNDEALANVATYIRNGWDNRASAVSSEDVARMRAKLKSRLETPFTEDELLKMFDGKKDGPAPDKAH